MDPKSAGFQVVEIMRARNAFAPPSAKQGAGETTPHAGSQTGEKTSSRNQLGSFPVLPKRQGGVI